MLTKTMYEIIWCYVSICTIFSIMFFCSWHDEKDKNYYGYFLSPAYIYNHSKMNVFGVTFSTIFLFILSPLYYMFLFIYWVCHVGRKS